MEIEYGNQAVIIVAGKNHQWMLRLVYKGIMRKNSKFAWSHSTFLKILITKGTIIGNLNDIKVQKDSRHHVLPAIDALKRAQHHLGFPKIHNPNIIMNKYQTNLNAGPCFKCLAIRFKSFKVMTARKDQGLSQIGGD